MNNSIFGQAQEAYDAGDYSSALDLFNAVIADNTFPLEPGEMGLVYHQIGNCLVKMKLYNDAIGAYVSAASDENYGSNGTVYYNLGMTYTYLNDFGNAVANFQTAVNNPTYKSKYKAYTAMGNALMKSGKSPEAGAVFRQAAMDPNNPDPTRALLNLGVCFMALGRPEDAVVAYESAFQFEMSPYVKNRLYANLGQAYVATGMMQKAVDAFEEALKDKTYQLSDSASVDYQRAVANVSKGSDTVDIDGSNNGHDMSAGAAVGAAAGAAAGIAAGGSAASAFANDAGGVTDTHNYTSAHLSESDGVASAAVSNLNDLNMVSASGAPDDGFANGAGAMQGGAGFVSPIDPSHDSQFSGNDADFEAWTKSTKEAGYNKQKKHSGVKIFLITLLIIILLLIGGCVALWFMGYGIPTQEMIINQTFENPLDSRDKVYANGVSDVKIQQYSSMVTQVNNVDIKAIERSVNDSTCYVEAKTSAGGDIKYRFKMKRDLFGWKIASIELVFASQNTD